MSRCGGPKCNAFSNASTPKLDGAHRRGAGGLAASVRIVHGRRDRHEIVVPEPPWSPWRLLPIDDVRAKVADCASGSHVADAIDEVSTMVEQLETMPCVSRLMRLLTVADD